MTKRLHADQYVTKYLLPLFRLLGSPLDDIRQRPLADHNFIAQGKTSEIAAVSSGTVIIISHALAGVPVLLLLLLKGFHSNAHSIMLYSLLVLCLCCWHCNRSDDVLQLPCRCCCC